MNFCVKKAPRSSRLVLGYPEPRPDWVQNGVSLDMLSRSEGIETSLPTYSQPSGLLTLDMLSRSEGIETYRCFHQSDIFQYTLDMLSRSEGIETAGIAPTGPLPESVLWICFPVRRELKHISREQRACLDIPFGYAFPFGGN